MKYKGKLRYLLAAGLLTLNITGCTGDVNKCSNIPRKTRNIILEKPKTQLLIETFRNDLQKKFSTGNVTLDKSSNEYITDIVIDGINVNIKLIDGSEVSGKLENLEISNVNFENFYIYDSKYLEDLFNTRVKEMQKGYSTGFISNNYEEQNKLNLITIKCSVSNEYKKEVIKSINWNQEIDYKECKKLWLGEAKLDEKKLEEISSMPNLDTLIITDPNISKLDKEVIKIHSKTLKNIIIDGTTGIKHHIDHFDFTESPNLEIISLMSNTQETNLDGLRGLKNLKELAFGFPIKSTEYDIKGLVSKDFQERIDLVSKQCSTDDSSLGFSQNSFISDISAINGANIEILNISFLKCVSSEMLLETVKTLPNLKQIVGFEVNNAGMCSDELIKYCYQKGIKHPFTEKSIEIKHKLKEIVSKEVKTYMTEEEKIKALSKYIIEHMEYDYELINLNGDYSDKVKRAWGESLYYSVMEEKGVCEGYTIYAQNLFTEAGIKSFKTDGLGHTWNLVQIDDEFYYIDLTNIDAIVDEEISSSFDNYDLDTYYLVPYGEEEDLYGADLIPNEVENKYNKTQTKVLMNDTKRYGNIKLNNYMIQVKEQGVNSRGYSYICGLVGILSALGLAKKVEHKEIKNLNKSISENIIEVKSSERLLETLNRIKQISTLIETRQLAEYEKYRNKTARFGEISQDKNGENR